MTVSYLYVCSTVGRCATLLTVDQRTSYILQGHLLTCNQTDKKKKIFNNSDNGWLTLVKRDEEEYLYSLGCREDVVDGHIIKQQHEWLPVLQPALWQHDTVDYTHYS